MAKGERKPGGELGFGLGGLLKGMGSLFDLVSRMSEEGTVTRSGEIKDPSGMAKAVYGITIRMGLGGEPTLEEFGNIRKTEQGVVVAEVREPLVDLFEEEDYLLMVAELPGVGEGDIHLEVKGDLLSLTAEGKERKYSKEVLLPSVVDADSMESTYKNGVLEIKLRKK